MAVERRYQVFVSSTYQDLTDERQEVMQALLELDCIPSGMELFPAANDDQWTLIKRVIDDCDYYIVIIAGRYGSLSDEGISYTEMEYRYAVSKGKPIIGFLHRDPSKILAGKYESDQGKQGKLAAFRDLVQQKLIKHWESPAELGSVVSRSLIRLIKDNPSVGWVRGDNISSDAAREEILLLRSRIQDLDSQLLKSNSVQPETYEVLSRGSDNVKLIFTLTVQPFAGGYFDRKSYVWELTSTWERIFHMVSPDMIDEASTQKIGAVVADRFRDLDFDEIREFCTKNKANFHEFSLTAESLNIIIVQFTALGLIAKGQKRRAVQDKLSYWGLTPAGERYMYEVRAIRRGENLGGVPPSEQ